MTGPKIYATVPFALLCGVAVVDVLGPAARRLWIRVIGPRASETDALPRGRVAACLLAALVLAFTWSAAAVPASFLGTLPRNERMAMQWAGASTPPESRFLVIGGDGQASDRGWALAADRTAEWFPALAQRASVTTYEGHEWLGDFTVMQHHALAALKCASRDSRCVVDLIRNDGLDFGYVFVPKAGKAGDGAPDSRSCCEALRSSLRADPSYSVIYDGAGATIFARRP